VFYRLHQLLPNHFLRIALIGFGIIAICSVIASLAFRGALPSVLVSFFYKLGTSWLMIMIYLLIFFIICDLLKLTPLDMERLLHHNWITLGALTLVLTVIFVAGYIRYQHKERVEINIDLPKEQALNKPVTIVAMSDLHLGYAIGNKELEKWVTLINNENPDIVLLIGDVIDNHISPAIEQKMDILFHKIRSKYGVYAISGNHEYISGINESNQFFKQCGITLLSDTMLLIDNTFYIAGRDDQMNRNRKNIKTICQHADISKPIILMDHQPFHLEEAAQNHITLQLSGHTHHGQLWPVSLITKLIYEKSHGYLKRGNTHYYITSGIGIWGGKFRIGTQSEYVVITLK
jgi:predicted MPP superfamily phosphohydrolase